MTLCYRFLQKKSNWDAPPDAAMAAIEPTANNPQLTFKARRIYVGNLPADPPIDDKQLREFFDQAMRQAGLLDPSNSDGCCVSDVWISAEKQFAFVEVRTVTDANNAMQLDGITLYGQALRVNRPSDYVPPPTAGPGAPGMPAPGMPGAPMGGMMPMGMGMIPGMMPPVNLKADLMQRTKKCRRVHIGNLPINVGLTPDALKQFINTVMQQMFLTVKPGEPVIDSFVSSDGKFGFVEMRTIQEATNALSMTGADCFGRYLYDGCVGSSDPSVAAGRLCAVIRMFRQVVLFIFPACWRDTKAQVLVLSTGRFVWANRPTMCRRTLP